MCRPSLTTAICLSVLIAALAGCGELGISKLNPFADPEAVVIENVREALNGKDGHSKIVGDYISVRHGEEMFVIEGIGIVVGLDGTGDVESGPPYRDLALEELRRRTVPRPEEFLDSPDTALVMVRGYVPPLVRKGDRIDVEVVIPNGTGATSLRGGVLLETVLSEHATTQGRGTLKGKSIGKAEGPILGAQIDTEHDTPVTQGFIPGGAIFTGEDRSLSIRLRPDYAYARMSAKIAQRIGERFHDYDRAGIQRKLADAKTHDKIDLQVHRRYRNNYSRYRQCIRLITLNETPIQRKVRMEQLSQALMSGPTAGPAALELEAIGREATPYLKLGLEADSLESRFHAAQALAYLGDTEGVETLTEAASTEPAFRVYALAALTATESPEALYQLNDLLSHDDIEARYGAFRAMTTISPRDPLVAGIPMKGEYTLHALQTSGPPVVHVTRWKKSEVVLFGAQQELQPPLFLRAGKNILIRSNPTGESIVVSLIAPGYRDQRVVSLKLAEVIATIDEFGGRYPEVVQMLVEADRQGNLPGTFGVDALPQANHVYHRDSSESDATSESSETPNLFTANDPTLEPTASFEDSASQSDQPSEPFEF